MKKFLTQIALPVLLFASGLHGAGFITGAEKIQFKDGKIFAWLNGQPMPVTNQVALPFNIVVQTNGTFAVAGGRNRALQDGDILGKDGMLLKTDGTVGLVLNHVAMKGGKVLRTEDGETVAASDELRLGDGTIVRPDGKVISPSGLARWLQDGELLQPQGGAFPSRDTITMQNGQVIVQKDGARITVGATRSITMNDGTKVMGDGTIIGFNGDRSSVAEGQIIPLAGIVVRPR